VSGRPCATRRTPPLPLPVLLLPLRLPLPRGGVYPGILTAVAKVMVSMPDDLLREVDAEARRLGTTRSAVLRRFADSALRERRAARAAAMRTLLEHPERYGGDAAESVKAGRPPA